MKHWTVGKRVNAIAALLLALLVLAGSVGMFGISSMKSSTAGMKEDYVAGLDKISKMESLIFELRGSTFFLSLPSLSPENKQKLLQSCDKMQAEVIQVMNDYDTSASISSAERPLFNALKPQMLELISLLEAFRQTAIVGKLDDATRTYEPKGVPLKIALKKAFDDEIEFNRRGINSAVDQINSDASTYSSATWIVLLLALGLGALVSVYTVRGIRSSLGASAKEIRASAQQVTSASNQVASASEQLAQGASQQAASLQETSASGQEVTAMTQRNSENSRTAADLMSEVDQRVGTANKKLEQLVVSMGEITNSSERIAKIIKVIDEIAFQTNILALNAAVEAARAGEAGLGFAVVADEVRNLAQRCAQAARDTTSLIEESVNNARNGGTRLDEVADVMRGITESAVKVKTLVDEVSHGGVEQSRGIDQISRALVQMEATTQQSAASAQQSASASLQLKAQAASMEQIVAALEALIVESAAPPLSRPVRVPVKTIGSKTVRKPIVKAPVQSHKTGLLPLQKAVGLNRPIVKPQPVAVGPAPVAVRASERNSFPLDDSEFQEF